jgi:hypothetical protein
MAGDPRAMLIDFCGPEIVARHRSENSTRPTRDARLCLRNGFQGRGVVAGLGLLPTSREIAVLPSRKSRRLGSSAHNPGIGPANAISFPGMASPQGRCLLC